MFLLHAMMHFYHHYEIPALHSGRVSASNMRIGWQDLLMSGLVVPPHQSGPSQPGAVNTTSNPNSIGGAVHAGRVITSQSRQAEGVFMPAVAPAGRPPESVVAPLHATRNNNIPPHVVTRNRSSSADSGTALAFEASNQEIEFELNRQANIQKMLNRPKQHELSSAIPPTAPAGLQNPKPAVGFVPYDLSPSRIRNPRNFPTKQHGFTNKTPGPLSTGSSTNSHDHGPQQPSPLLHGRQYRSSSAGNRQELNFPLTRITETSDDDDVLMF